MKLHIARSAFVGALAVAAATLLAACGSTDPQTDASAGGTATNSFAFAGDTSVDTTSCADAKPTIKKNTPTIALLGVQGDGLTGYLPDINMVLATAQQDQARVIVNGVSGSTNAPNLLTNVVMTPEGNNDLMRRQDMKCKAALVGNALNALKDSKAPAQVDVFDAISALAGNLEKDPSTRPVDVVLLTPLDAHASGVNLRDPKTLADPVGVINKLASQGLIPSCKNYRFYAVSPSRDLGDVQAAKLKTFWQTYAAKCGGEVVAWAPHLGTFPVTSAIGIADTSLIQVKEEPKKITATLGADVLFGPDSASLKKGSHDALTQLLDLVKQYSGKVVITGHVNARQTTADGQTLSEQRAESVKAWLVAQGVPAHRITTVGKGAADPVYANPKTTQENAANRRVVTVIYTTGA